MSLDLYIRQWRKRMAGEGGMCNRLQQYDTHIYGPMSHGSEIRFSFFFFFFLYLLSFLTFFPLSLRMMANFVSPHSLFLFLFCDGCLHHWSLKRDGTPKVKKNKRRFSRLFFVFFCFFLVICRRKTWKESAHAHLRLNISWRKELSWETTGLVRFPCNFISFLTAVTVPFLQVFDSSFSWSFLFIVELSWLFDFWSFHPFAMKWTNGMVSNDKR